MRAVNVLGDPTQIFAEVIEVDQMTALQAKLLLHLVGDPRRPVTDDDDEASWPPPPSIFGSCHL